MRQHYWARHLGPGRWVEVDDQTQQVRYEGKDLSSLSWPVWDTLLQTPWMVLKQDIDPDLKLAEGL